MLGYDESEHLEAEPVRYCVRMAKRERRVCRGCEQGTVTIAQMGPRTVEKGLASNAVMIDTMVAKTASEIAREAAELVRALYDVEREAKELSAVARLELRRRDSAPALNIAS